LLVVNTTPEHAELKAICSSGRESAHSNSVGGQSRLTSAATGVVTRHHSHHYFGFAETQWKLFLKGEAEDETVGTSCGSSETEAAQQRTPYQRPRRVKPLLYVYRVLLTGCLRTATI
jgi:uncharacterized protein